uniref:Uncharacterized protein n=1 Tax=Timema shepardi TaxID=629360 RepID=A0A7R9APU9_TIMSH|nr:unnamed protein product [Timema shepardi]
MLSSTSEDGESEVRISVAEAGKKVWTSGCIEIVRSWAEKNLYTIAGFALGIALSQLFVIYLAKTLEGQIDLQKSRCGGILPTGSPYVGSTGLHSGQGLLRLTATVEKVRVVIKGGKRMCIEIREKEAIRNE